MKGNRGQGGSPLRPVRGLGPREVEVEEIGHDVLVGLGSGVGQRVAFGEGPAGACVGPDVRPVLAPLDVGVGGGVGGQNGRVELAVGQLQPRRALVVQLRQGPPLELGVPRRLGRRGLAEHAAEVEEVLLAGRPLGELDRPPLGFRGHHTMALR